MAYKVFTNGSVLQASEVNQNLMQQAVATFSNAAARTAAITSPVEGQMTYLEDVDRYDHWNGSAWVSPFGMTLLNSTSITSATTVNVNNVFSSTYNNYKILFNLTNISGANTNVFMRMRVGGVDSTTSSYFRGSFIVGSTVSQALVSDNNLTTADWPVIDGVTTASGSSDITLYNPARTVNTQISLTAASGYLRTLGGVHTVATAYDGFTFYSSASMTGIVRIYGLRN